MKRRTDLNTHQHDASRTVLHLLHNASWTENRIVDLLEEAGHLIRTIVPTDGEPLPTTLDGVDAVMIGGHHISPYAAADHDHIADELRLIEQVLERDLPYLGICFGAQALATVLGGPTGPRPDGAAEFGFYEIEPTPAGTDVIGGLTHVFQSHYESCLSVPDGAELLATSELCDVQAFRVGTSAFGFQFHLDTRADMIEGWWAGNPHLHGRTGTHSLEQQLRDATVHESSIHEWSRWFLRDWLGTTS